MQSTIIYGEAQLQRVLATQPHAVVLYYQDCLQSTRMQRELQQFLQTPQGQRTSVLLVSSRSLPEAYFKRRAMTRLPVLSCYAGTREFERITMALDHTQIAAAASRLHDHTAITPAVTQAIA